ncbi:MAG TPA: hypothetical protein VFQ53_19890 [Kofleriaceae bacterium]|nr:hypothetical protein [Kofleriaceae bacterium]
MTATASSYTPSTKNGQPGLPRIVPPFPTATALALERATHHQLDVAFLRGTTPDVDHLVGWEFRGINHPGWARLAGIKKFVKGFFRDDDGKVMGYNSPVVQNVLDGRWHTKPSDTAPKRFGYYEVIPVDATARDNAYLHAVLLDYGRGGNKLYDPTRGIRDYLVQVDPDNPDLYLGKAYYALGPLRVHSNFFILERFRRGLTNYARR